MKKTITKKKTVFNLGDIFWELDVIYSSYKDYKLMPVVVSEMIMSMTLSKSKKHRIKHCFSYKFHNPSSKSRWKEISIKSQQIDTLLDRGPSYFSTKKAAQLIFDEEAKKDKKLTEKYEACEARREKRLAIKLAKKYKLI